MLMIALAAGLFLAQEPTEPTTKKVVIDGKNYRVKVRGQEVEVASKGLVAFKSLDGRDRMRRAVTAATGCKIVDELPISSSILQGRLLC
jgi:hypothetical protein